ncbi:MAG: hypothetical protein IKN46_01635 [Acholeplasmatales bacterium]|nr:hypothetical protein [Acholeplasmatales bacterium]
MSNFPRYDTKLFCEIFEDVNEFLDFYNDEIDASIKVFDSTDSTDLNTLKRIYYLLYARYGNNPIANYDEFQFAYKLFTVIFQYGPTWAKRLDVQEKLRNLTDDQLRMGSKAVFDHAYNPTEMPSSDGELSYINEQNKTKYTKSPLEGYAILEELLRADVTNDFLAKFQKLFKQFVRPEKTWIYITDLEEDGE